MVRDRKSILVFLLFLQLLCIKPLWSDPLSLVVGFGLSLEPYVFSNKNKGIEYDIIKAALASQGISMQARYFPFARASIELIEGNVDAAATTNENISLKGLFFSDEHIQYQNTIIALSGQLEPVNRLSELDPKSYTIGFQGASAYLGEEFARFAKNNPNYKEWASQEKQVKALFYKKTELIAIDKNIFQHYRQKVEQTVSEQAVRIIFKFEPSRYKVAFRSKEIRDQFNVGLKTINANGTVHKIFEKYGISSPLE